MIHPARAELLALAAAVRGDDWAAELDGALAAAAANGWTWERAGRAASLLIFNDTCDPKALRDAASSPVERHKSSPPTAEYAAAKAALENRERAS